MTSPDSPLDLFSESLADAVERIAPSVVSVHARRRLPGTGTIWQANDALYVVTASHIVEREENIAVSFGDRELLPATLLSRDFASDLAVLRVDALTGTAVSLRSRPARVGNLVLAVGRPFGPPSSTFGAITAIGSVQFHRFQTPTLIYAETTALPGFSGGPLIDAEGATLGINTSGLLRRGRFLGGSAGMVTIPAQQVEQVVADIAEFGHVRYGWIGVAVQPVDLPEASRDLLDEQETGLLVTGVTPESPAAVAGLVVGDILVTMADQPLADISDLQHLLGGRLIGTQNTVGLLRGGQRQSVEVTPAERPERPRT
jgi:S1-C subfamily serine protease